MRQLFRAFENSSYSLLRIIKAKQKALLIIQSGLKKGKISQKIVT